MVGDGVALPLPRCFLHSAYALRINRNIHCRHVHLFCIYGTSGTIAHCKCADVRMAEHEPEREEQDRDRSGVESSWNVARSVAHMARGIKLFNWWWLLVEICRVEWSGVEWSGVASVSQPGHLNIAFHPVSIELVFAVLFSCIPQYLCLNREIGLLSISSNIVGPSTFRIWWSVIKVCVCFMFRPTPPECRSRYAARVWIKKFNRRINKSSAHSVVDPPEISAMPHIKYQQLLFGVERKYSQFQIVW